MSKQVMQRAADALWVLSEHDALHFGENHNTVVQGRAAIAELRAAIAQPEVEPVGHFYFDRDDFTYKQAKDKISFPACIKLYTTPPDTEAMRRDAERLQHLCDSVRCASANIDGKHGWNFLHGKGWAVGATFREAIDAAIEAQKGTK